MKYRLFSIALSAAALALSASTAFAGDTPAVAPQTAASKAAPDPAKEAKEAKAAKAAKRKAEVEAKRKAAAKIKLVDINTATSQELMKLPGISDADASKIIAARPYGSKIWLMTHKVLPAEKYQAISDLIAAKNAARAMTKK